jgi:hypothetical protein
MGERSGYQLAQVNVARLRAPLDDPMLAEFVANLEPVNGTAEQADGFVWRLRDGADATSIEIFEDPWLIVNMSVWQSPQQLLDFVYGDTHRAVLRRRREWFTQLAEAMTALWWVPAGHHPSVAQAEERLTRLRQYGPAAEAFTFGQLFPAPDGQLTR